MNDHPCNDCNTKVGPGSRIRLVGRDRTGRAVELCSRCWIERNRQEGAK